MRPAQLFGRSGICLILGIQPIQAHAQTEDASPPDFDSFAACAIVYQEISAIYIGRGDQAQGDSFASTATAYASSALYSLPSVRTDPEGATTYADARIADVARALNEASQADPDGDMGVIEDWLPYCDELAGHVQTSLEERQEQGW